MLIDDGRFSLVNPEQEVDSITPAGERRVYGMASEAWSIEPRRGGILEIAVSKGKEIR